MRTSEGIETKTREEMVPDCAAQREGGVMKTFLIDYTHNGQQWQVEIKATCWSDAANKLDAIKRNGHVVGELACSVPVPTWWQRLFGWN